LFRLLFCWLVTGSTILTGRLLLRLIAEGCSSIAIAAIVSL
jgi:hypothetical protein